MSKKNLTINLIRSKLLKLIDSEIEINKVKQELPSLNKSPLDFQNNIVIEMKEYSHSLEKIMRGFDSFFKGNTIIQFKRKKKNKISTSTKHMKIIKINSQYPFKYLEHVCSMVKIPIKGRSKTEINSVIKIDCDNLIEKSNNHNIHFDKFIVNV